MVKPGKYSADEGIGAVVVYDLKPDGKLKKTKVDGAGNEESVASGKWLYAKNELTLDWGKEKEVLEFRGAGFAWHRISFHRKGTSERVVWRVIIGAD